MVTCKDCEIYNYCKDPHKSTKVDKEYGDSYAYYCDDFSPVRPGKTITVDGLVVSQSSTNCHVMVVEEKTGKPIAHIAATKEFNEDQLKDIGEHYSKKMRGSELWG